MSSSNPDSWNYLVFEEHFPNEITDGASPDEIRERLREGLLAGQSPEEIFGKAWQVYIERICE